MGNIVIAPVGDNLKALFVGMKKFPTEKVILITPTDNIKSAKKLEKKLKEFTINSEIIEIRRNVMEDMFMIFGKLCSLYDPDELIVNVSTGDRITSCAALSAAYANGLKAIGVVGTECMLLPIMKLSYYNELSENKLNILEKLSIEKFKSLTDLSKKLKMSSSLISYHINGTYKYKGLKDFRLVEVNQKNKNLYVKLSQMGNLLLKGYIKKR